YVRNFSTPDQTFAQCDGVFPHALIRIPQSFEQDSLFQLPNTIQCTQGVHANVSKPRVVDHVGEQCDRCRISLLVQKAGGSFSLPGIPMRKGRDQIIRFGSRKLRELVRPEIVRNYSEDAAAISAILHVGYVNRSVRSRDKLTGMK